MFAWLANVWRVPELRRRLLFTAGVLAVYRFGSWVPAPGVDQKALQQFFGTGGGGQGVLSLLNLFSGSALSRFSLFALGIMPYVTASIILQLLTVVVPAVDRLQKEVESGYAFLFKRQDALPNVNSGRLVIIVLTLTAGCVLLMWMGEQITKRGIGNGISLLIFASILTYMPTGINAWINGGATEK